MENAKSLLSVAITLFISTLILLMYSISYKYLLVEVQPNDILPLRVRKLLFIGITIVIILEGLERILSLIDRYRLHSDGKSDCDK